MKKRSVIILSIILILVIIIGLMFFKKPSSGNLECVEPSDCVASSCCHAEGCVAKENAPNCEGVFCTMVCSGPLDCGQGICGCVKGNCEVIQNEPK